MFLFSVNLRILVYPANPYLCILFLLLFCMIPNFPYLIFSNLSLWSLELVSCKLSMSIYSLFLINSFLASNEQSSLFNSWQPSQWQDYFSLLSQVQKELCIFLFSTAYSTCFLHLSSRNGDFLEAQIVWLCQLLLLLLPGYFRVNSYLLKTWSLVYRFPFLLYFVISLVFSIWNE